MGHPALEATSPVEPAQRRCGARSRSKTLHSATTNYDLVTDLVEIRTAEGTLYICTIKDIYDIVTVAW